MTDFSEKRSLANAEAFDDESDLDPSDIRVLRSRGSWQYATFSWRRTLRNPPKALQICGCFGAAFLLILLISFTGLVPKSVRQEVESELEELVPGNSIIKSASDKRSYGIVTLANGLRGVVISDPETDRAAAALAVGVGSYQDPGNALGLAHFCEHMLFMGSEKYPKENEYGSWLSQHGGTFNAYTASEITNYFFEVMADHLEGTLDRFSRFFIDPLFSPSSVDREKHAVDSEYRNDLTSDGWRQEILVRTNGNPKSSFSKFNIGSVDPSPTGKEPTLLNVTRDQLLAFHAQHYYPESMRVVVLGKESVDELKEMVKTKFSAAKRQQPHPALDSLVPPPNPKESPFSNDQMGKKVLWLPMKNNRALSLLWPLSARRHLYAKKAEKYIASLLGDEGTGSIISSLRSKGWAQGISAYVDYDSKEFAVFRIDIDLLEAGVPEVDAIIEEVYAYIGLVAKEGIESWRYDEMKSLDELEFRFAQKMSPFNYVGSVARYLHTVGDDNIRDVLFFNHKWTSLDKKVVEELIDQLQIANMALFVGAQDFSACIETCNCPDQNDGGSKCDYFVEDYFGIKYNVLEVSGESKARWLIARQTHPTSVSHGLPGINEFIPTDFEVKSTGAALDQTRPKPVLASPGSFLWHKLEGREGLFPEPRAVFTCHLESPTLKVPSATNSARGTLWTRIYSQIVAEKLYPAIVAGFSVSISKLHEGGLRFTINGYNDKLRNLLDATLDQITNLEQSPDLDSAFANQKQQLLQDLRNSLFDPAYRQAYDFTWRMLVKGSWSPQEALQAVQDIGIEEIKTFVNDIGSELRAECLAHGNLLEDEAQDLHNTVVRRLQNGVLSDEKAETLRLQLLIAPVQDSTAQLDNTNEDDDNTAIEEHFQLGSSHLKPKEDAVLTLLGDMMREPAFDTLRTKEQLGYIVFAFRRQIFASTGLSIVVQSPLSRTGPAGASFLKERVNAFLGGFGERISNFTEVDLQSHKDAAIGKLLKKPDSLGALTEHCFAEILNKQYMFDRKQMIAANLGIVTVDRLRAFFDTLVCSENSRRKITTLVSPTPAQWPVLQPPAQAIPLDSLSIWQSALPNAQVCH